MLNFDADLFQHASDAEIAGMQALVQEALTAGAIGVSTGLFYEPALDAPQGISLVGP
jgi:N-acyl-D-amino-acid deacylase